MRELPHVLGNTSSEGGWASVMEHLAQAERLGWKCIVYQKNGAKPMVLHAEGVKETIRVVMHEGHCKLLQFEPPRFSAVFAFTRMHPSIIL